MGNAESESKKQILVNAFNSKESIVSKNTLYLMNFTIGAFISLLVLVSTFSITYISHNQSLWTDIRFLLTTKQTISFKIALIETEIFQSTL